MLFKLESICCYLNFYAENGLTDQFTDRSTDILSDVIVVLCISMYF